MITINYKRLVEIRVLHDYFLTGEEGVSFFSLGSTEKQQQLEKLVQSNQYNILKALRIEPHPATAIFMKNHKMKLISGSLGAFLAIQVNAENDAGDVVYEPFVPLSDDDELIFYLKSAHPLFHNFTNLPWQGNHLPTQFLFANGTAREIGGEKVLSRNTPALGTFPEYVMGDLVEDGGAVKEVYFPLTASTQSLLTLAGDGFVNVADRRLLPKAFYFDFLLPITDEATFAFFDSGNNLLKSIQKSGDAPYRFVKLDFTATDDDPPVPIPDGDYRLEVTTDGGFNGIYEMTFSDTLYNADAIGIVRFRVRTGDMVFDLLDGDGRLHARVLADGTKMSHPVFELRFLSRRTYWRYQQKGGFSGASPSPDYLELIGDKLVSKSPRPLTASLTYYEEGGAPRQYLPNAKPSPLKFEEKKIFSEIYVSSVNRLAV